MGGGGGNGWHQQRLRVPKNSDTIFEESAFYTGVELAWGGMICRGLSTERVRFNDAVTIHVKAPETGFSHRLIAYKIMGHFFGLSYLNISVNDQVENSFFRISIISASCPHAHDIFRTLGSRSLSVSAMLNFSGKANA